MKKILAAMIIAVIAVAGVFADMTGMTAGTNNINLEYTVTDTFSAKYGFKVAVDDGPATDYETSAVDAGTDFRKIAAGYVTISIYDMSYCNSAVAKASTVKLEMPAAWIDKGGAETGATFAVKTVMAADTTGDTVGTTTTLMNGDTIKVAYPESQIVDRYSDAKAVLVGTVAYEWIEDAEVVAGTATASITVTIASV